MEVGVVTWNVLADAYLAKERYPEMPAELRRSGERWPLVAAMVSARARDIVALQEAEAALADRLRLALGDEWDVRSCPRGSSRVDGCVTAVHRRWTVVADVRHQYHDPRPSGRVAHLLTIEKGGFGLTVANTHLRWSPPGVSAEHHAGMRQARELLESLDPLTRSAIIAGDLNDEPGGPVRQLLVDAGWIEVQDMEPTALVESEPLALDVIAVRCLQGRPESASVGVSLSASSIPSLACPSDHLPVMATILGQ